MAKKELFIGFVLLNSGGGLVPVEIYEDDYKDEVFTYAYVNGEMADDADNSEDFADAYGDVLYYTIQDFKDDNAAGSVGDFWDD